MKDLVYNQGNQKTLQYSGILKVLRLIVHTNCPHSKVITSFFTNIAFFRLFHSAIVRPVRQTRLSAAVWFDGWPECSGYPRPSISGLFTLPRPRQCWQQWRPSFLSLHGLHHHFHVMVDITTYCKWNTPYHSLVNSTPKMWAFEGLKKACVTCEFLCAKGRLSSSSRPRMKARKWRKYDQDQFFDDEEWSQHRM